MNSRLVFRMAIADVVRLYLHKMRICLMHIRKVNQNTKGKKLPTIPPNKTCQLDPASTWLVKDMIGLLSPFIALLINKSLTTGCFPTEFKKAIVRPLLKRGGLDLTDLKNYRPVSNLPFLSKLLERVVQARLQAHLDGSSLLPGWQSAYHRLHTPKPRLRRCLMTC